MNGASHLRLVPPAIPVDGLTRVELTWIEKKVEYWIRFGKEKEEQILDRRRRTLSFASNSIFAGQGSQRAGSASLLGSPVRAKAATVFIMAAESARRPGALAWLKEMLE